jgi:DNA ligase D-like protein (predicted 3'-phosphoesterase)
LSCPLNDVLKFVIQEHYARSHHFDFRLERDGVFKSWAVPKGIPEEPGIKRLAIQVDDHMLAFGEFEGIIPQGQYGAGAIHLWDQGTYELFGWSWGRIVFSLQGKRIDGLFSMVRFKNKNSHKWLLSKIKSDELPLSRG